MAPGAGSRAHLVHVPQPAPCPQHLVASPQPLGVPSPQRGHRQVPHEAATAEQQVLYSAHEHRSHCRCFPSKPGVPDTGFATLLQLTAPRGSDLPPNSPFTVCPGQVGAACPGIGRQPANGCGWHGGCVTPPARPQSQLPKLRQASPGCSLGAGSPGR